MKYKDNGYVKNASYVGVSFGTKLKDNADTSNDGYDDVRSYEHIGTVLQDIGTGVNPVPILISIKITTNPTKLAYSVGDTLDLTGIVVKGTRSGGATETIAVTTKNVTGFDSSVAVANQTLTITVEGCKATFNISVS